LLHICILYPSAVALAAQQHLTYDTQHNCTVKPSPTHAFCCHWGCTCCRLPQLTRQPRMASLLSSRPGVLCRQQQHAAGLQPRPAALVLPAARAFSGLR
jgi:hypothetical protein